MKPEFDHLTCVIIIVILDTLDGYKSSQAAVRNLHIKATDAYRLERRGIWSDWEHEFME